MKLVGMERLAPSVEETPDSTWIVPSRVSADDLEESLEFINRAEFDPPTFDNDQSAEDQLRRKPTVRKKVTYDDDDGADGTAGLLGDDEVLFPAGGPTARKAVEDTLGNRKTIRRRRKKNDDDGEVDGPTEAELDERAKLRRIKELEKARRVKSDVYVHASDDETDDEKDRGFFEREAATRQRIHDAVADGVRSTLAAKPTNGDAGTSKKARTKRKSTVLSDDSDEDSDGDSGHQLLSSSQDLPALPSGARRSRKRRKSSEEITGTDEDEDGDDEDEAAEDRATPKKKANVPKRQHAGFVDSSDDDDDDKPDKGASNGNGGGEAMDTDDTPLSSSPVDKESSGAAKPPPPVLSEKTGGQIQLNGSNINKKTDEDEDGDDDDDDDDILPAAGKKRLRAKAGLVIDSDDE